MTIDKPLGGRGKKESYNSYVVRLPETLKSQVNELLDKFHASRTKYVSGKYYQLPASMVCEIMKVIEPVEDADLSLSIDCGYPRYDDYKYCNWSNDWDEQWTATELPKIERFHQLADQVNLCIWQVDNSFAITHPDTVRDACELLVEYGLVQMDKPTLPASAKALFDWVTGKQGCRTCYRDTILDAFEEEQYDMLVALEVGVKTPVNRTEYWHSKYKEQLATPKINYWSWFANPESRDICPELLQLLELPAPHPHAAKVLECLAEGKDPFFTPETNGTYMSFEKFLTKGDLADYNPEMKKIYRRAFTEWHFATLSQLGQEMLARIYMVVYKTHWSLIEAIISTMSGEWWEVLQVNPSASHTEVKKAYRRLAATWHPDINPSPKAPQYMSTINRAFEQYEKTCYKYSK